MTFKNVTVLDVQGSSVPEEVRDAAREYWAENCLGNDYYYVPWHSEITEEENEDYRYTAITKYITDSGENPRNGCVLIHYWW